MTTHLGSQSVLHDRIAAWTHDLAPRNAVETFLTQHAARLSCELDHAAKVEADRRQHLARTAPVLHAQRLAAEVINLGHELIDPSTEVWLQRNPSWTGGRTGKPDADPAPRPPELLVNLLEASAPGCHWLWERWKELAELMHDRLTWGPADERKALRLLGMPPDVEDNSAIRELRLTVMSFLGNPSQLPIPEGKSVPPREEARCYIEALCERKMNELAQREAYLKSIFVDPEGSTRHEFDPGEAGKQMRRHQATTHRELLKTLELLMKLKKAPATVEPIARLGAPAPLGKLNEGRAVHADSKRKACTVRSTKPGTADRTSPRPDRGLTPPVRLRAKRARQTYHKERQVKVE